MEGACVGKHSSDREEESARATKKIQRSMPGTESIRRAIWQGNRISNNDATLIIMRLPPYSSICPFRGGGEKSKRTSEWKRERKGG